MVYLVADINKKHCKIGNTNNMKKRMSGLQTASPYKLFVVYVIGGDKSIEDALHKKFAHLRGEGEWFTYCKSIEDCFKYNNPLSDEEIQKGDAEEPSIYSFDGIIKIVNELDSCGIKVLMYCAINCKRNANTILLDSEGAEMAANSLGLATSSIKNSTSKLSKLLALIPCGKAKYMVNPTIFWNGTLSRKPKSITIKEQKLSNGTVRLMLAK